MTRLSKRNIKVIFVTILLNTIVSYGSEDKSLAKINLYNSTNWSGPTTVEIPVGKIAAPGLINWQEINLIYGNKKLPFAIREGKAHWKAQLKTPILSPRAEDILVFSCEAAPKKWTHIDIVSGDADMTSAVSREKNSITISYSNLKAVIDANTASLQQLIVLGESVLASPLSIVPHKLADKGYEYSGSLASGYYPGAFNLHKQSPIKYTTRMVSLSSVPAMTEVSFVIEADSPLKMSLTYRIHANGYVEILADSQLWTGTSPWIDYAVEFNLLFKGQEEKLSHFENRFPLYGFKAFTAALKYTGRLYKNKCTGILVFGEETINGRKWTRKIYTYSNTGRTNPYDLVEIADEGLIVDILPVQSKRQSFPLDVIGPKQAQAAAQNLVTKLNKIGISAKLASKQSTSYNVLFELIGDNHGNIAADGFAVIAQQPHGFRIQATTVLGLYKASNEISEHFQNNGASVGFPLIAQNPIVALRGTGFGGGNFEVDFPYGSDEEWKNVFEQLLNAGVNTFWPMGIWCNWKFPVSYKYIPKLSSNSPDVYDEVSGTAFSQYERHSQHGRHLIDYLHKRGAKVFLWLPIGCVPNNFADVFPEAVAPDGISTFWGRKRVTPCFSHPAYHKYLAALIQEMLETYALDGFIMIRDDNGGLCSCDNCKKYIASSRTKDLAWEQYLLIYDIFREQGFKGVLGVYPYFDGYDISKLEKILPADLYVVGHGGGGAMLTRDFEYIGSMPDTWLDNLYANFRLPPSSRMRRLLSDRGTLWIGGAYCGTELMWEAIGAFGWEPTATVNTFRYKWGSRTFGKENALVFVQMNDAYEQLWEFNALEMLPKNWIEMDTSLRSRIFQEILLWLTNYRDGLANLKQVAGPDNHKKWFGHLDLFAPFIEYHLYRLELLAQIYDLIMANRDKLEQPGGLPPQVRAEVLCKYDQMYEWLGKYGHAIENAPGDMLKNTRNVFPPDNLYHEWVAGYGPGLDNFLEIKQFVGTMNIKNSELKAGQAFCLNIELHNKGILPWRSGVGHSLILSKEAESLGLALKWDYEGKPMAPGDRRVVVLEGQVPTEAGKTTLTVSFTNSFRPPGSFIEQKLTLSWGL